MSKRLPHGIPVVFARQNASVEFTLGLILAEFKSIARAHQSLAQGRWLGELYCYDRAPKELLGATIGLVGFGAIAQMLVPYLHPFQIRILAYDPYITDEKFMKLEVEKTSLNQLLEQSDIVSLHARVTPETKKMMGVEQFKRMKPGAYFINTARGHGDMRRIRCRTRAIWLGLHWIRSIKSLRRLIGLCSSWATSP
jgi:D-3-phosphoglycerate dehydrogenase